MGNFSKRIIFYTFAVLPIIAIQIVVTFTHDIFLVLIVDSIVMMTLVPMIFGKVTNNYEKLKEEGSLYSAKFDIIGLFSILIPVILAFFFICYLGVFKLGFVGLLFPFFFNSILKYIFIGATVAIFVGFVPFCEERYETWLVQNLPAHVRDFLFVNLMNTLRGMPILIKCAPRGAWPLIFTWLVFNFIIGFWRGFDPLKDSKLLRQTLYISLVLVIILVKYGPVKMKQPLHIDLEDPRNIWNKVF